MSSFKAVIFDLDGTLIDSERLTLRAFQQAGGELGLQISEEVSLSLIGLDARSSKEKLILYLGTESLYKALLERVRAIRNSEALQLKLGAREILEFVQKAGLLSAIATSTRAEYVEILLDKLDLRRYIGLFVGGDQVARGKPAPEIYLRAAERLGVAANSCIAFEDSEPGVLSATSAGMYVVHVPDIRQLPAPIVNLAQSVQPSLVEAKTFLKNLLEER